MIKQGSIVLQTRALALIDHRQLAQLSMGPLKMQVLIVLVEFFRGQKSLTENVRQGVKFGCTRVTVTIQASLMLPEFDSAVKHVAAENYR